MAEKKERKPPITVGGVNDRVKKLEDAPQITLASLIRDADPLDMNYLRQKVVDFTPDPKPPLRWPRLLVAFVLGCYCMALGLTVWRPALPTIDKGEQEWSSTVPKAVRRDGQPELAFTWTPSVEPLENDVKHLSITNTGATRCWVGITKDVGQIVISQDYLNPDATEGTDAHPVTIRDSCPGELTFERGGEMLHPVPESGHRADVEVVVIP
jgi:hypothetical protein